MKLYAPNSRKLVPDDGLKSARLVLIGEAPGEREEESGRPFVGPTYTQRLKPWWRRYGVPDRDGWYITNVLPWRPKNIDDVPREEMEHHIAALHERLAALDDPWLIVPTGNYALYALTGKGKVSWHTKDGHHERPGITSWRSSILPYTDRRGRTIKVIPTIHPAATFKVPKYEAACLHDWQRIAADQHFRELRTTESEHRIRPTRREVAEFVRAVLGEARDLSIDIETPRRLIPQMTKAGKPSKRLIRSDPYLGCIGFAYSTKWSLTIPTTAEYWTDPADFAFVMGAVATLLCCSIDKVGQNFAGFDAYWLTSEGFPFAGYLWDTRAMHHVLDPRDQHDLAYLQSVFTRRPFHKDEAKDPDEIAKWASNSDALWSYCGMDVCSTLEIKERLHERLVTADMLAFYDRHYAQIFPVLLDISLHGIRVDTAARDTKRKELLDRCDVLAKEIAELAGFPLVAKKAIGRDRLAFYLYGDAAFKTEKEQARLAKLKKKYPNAVACNLPIQTKRDPKSKTRKLTVDEVALRKLQLEYPDKLDAVATRCLEHRRKLKLSEFVSDTIADGDGRVRCELSPITELGRLAAKENPKTTGRNLQNIDREMRDVFVPDEDAA